MTEEFFEEEVEDHILLGKVINKVLINQYKDSLIFCCGDDVVLANCIEDQCSDTWIEHVELPAMGFPSLVTEIDELAFNSYDDNDPIYGCIQTYGVKITTSKGEIIIDYRNGSNGHYGGDMTWSLLDSPLDLENWSEIKSDV